MKQNMGRLDRTLRIVAAAALVPIGLFALGGWQGSLVGILVVAVGVLLLVTGLTGFCLGSVLLGISTTGATRTQPRVSRHRETVGTT